MAPRYSDVEIRKKGSYINIDNQQEAAFVLWCILKQEDDGPGSLLQACMDTLSGDEKLYCALKAAHARGVYDPIREWNGSPGSRINLEDSRVERDVRTFLNECQPTMNKLVAGDITWPMWSPPSGLFDPEITDHLTRLQIPCLRGRPNLLLHDLGSFQSDDTLRKRLKNIFMPCKDTFLVNTSGSGKTRLLLEGLCENWGFYFTSVFDSDGLGSSDMQKSIQTYVPDSPKFRTDLPPKGSSGYDNALKTNREIASRVFRQIFLARLMIFHLFVETMTEHINSNSVKDLRVYKTRWLLLQLRPSFFNPRFWDVFDQLSCKLSAASNSFITTTTKTLLTKVRGLCSAIETYTAQAPLLLFCVLDEAQYAATQHSSSFRSDDSDAHRPILGEIVDAWERQFSGEHIFMVVAGTGISKDIVNQGTATAVRKQSRYRWCSDTGAFDQRDIQRRYVEKYIPQNILQSDTGARLLERLWYWLRGRHRFTSAYLSELLINGFKRPHGLLNVYIQHFTDFEVSDARQCVETESRDELPSLWLGKLNFAILEKNSDMLATIQQLTTHHVMRSVLPETLGNEGETYVEYGFARFVDSFTKTASVDEPLVLLALTHWINADHLTSYKLQFNCADSNGFQNYIAFAIGMLFSQPRRVNEVFSFPRAPPEWSNLEAELVALHRTVLDNVEENVARHCRSMGPSVTLGIDAKSAEETAKWLQHGSPAPICFPHASMGPDLLFALKLSDGSLIWVALQAKYLSSMSKTVSLQAMRSVTPSAFFLDKDGNPFSPSSHPDLVDETRNLLSSLPHKRTDAGRFSLLRVVVSFPANTNLKRYLKEDPDKDGHPIASLNMSLVKSITEHLSPIDFLQGLEDPLQNTGKRKRNTDGT